MDYVVEGSVRRAGDDVTLAVQLIRAADQAHVCARRYDAKLDGIFALQRRVAYALAERIGVVTVERDPDATAAPEALPSGRKCANHDVIAYNLYTEGRHYLERGESPESWKKARECFENAVERDEQFAAAYDALAELWWLAGFFGQVPPRQALSIGIVHAIHAVDLDSTLADAHAMLAQYRKQVTYNWNEVDREMAVARELNPASPVVRMRYAVTCLMPHGRIKEAITELEGAIEVDPLALWPRVWLEVMLWLERRYDVAIEQGRLVLEIAPTNFIGHFALGLVYRDARRFDEAIAAHDRAADLTSGAPMMLGWLGFALAESGDIGGARRLLTRLHDVPQHVYVPPSSIACIHFGLGEIDAFFQAMERAIAERDHMVMPIKTYPFLDPVRSDSRYVGLLRKLNLA